MGFRPVEWERVLICKLVISGYNTHVALIVCI